LVVVTTGLAASRWTATLRRHRDAQLVVLAFDDARHGMKPPSPDTALILDARDNPLVRLVHGWERICNDGWSRN
jgi:hypothetical protein